MKKLISASLVFSLALTLLLGLLPAVRAEEAAPAEPVEYVPVSYTHLTLPTIYSV